jgi:hypothetical protein
LRKIAALSRGTEAVLPRLQRLPKARHADGYDHRTMMLTDAVAITLFSVVFVALCIWQMRAQLRFEEEADARRGTTVGFEHDAELAERNPLRFFLGIPRRTAQRSKLLYQRQDDAHLEALRSKYFVRRNVWLAGSLLSFVALSAYLLGR